MLFLFLEAMSPRIIFLFMAYGILYGVWYFTGAMFTGLTLALIIMGIIKVRGAR